MKKNILITGGTSGIGFNAAKNLVTDPINNLIIIGNNKTKGENAHKNLLKISENKNVSYLTCDLSSLKEIKKFFEINKLPKLDVLVNNAGAVFFNKTFSSEKIEKTFALNHLGYFFFTKISYMQSFYCFNSAKTHIMYVRYCLCSIKVDNYSTLSVTL